MHILYIHQYFNTPEEGGGTRSYEFARKLVSLRHKVTMIASCNEMDNTKEIIEGINVVYLKVPYSNHMSFKRRLLSFILFGIKAIFVGFKIKNCDLVFATSTPLIIAIPGIILSFIKRIPMVFEVRDLWPEVPIQMGVIKSKLLIKILRWFERFTYKYSKHIVALSPGMMKGIIDASIEKGKITMIPNFCNTDFFKPEESNKELVKELEDIGEPIISYAGAISYANNVELIIDTAEKLQKKGQKLLFVIAGDGSLKQELENKSKKLGLQNVLFLGKINKYEVLELYRKSLATLVLFKKLPVLTTNSPNKFFDAISTGKPVITNMDGWIGNLIEEYKIGFSIDPDDANSLMKAVIDMVNMDENKVKEMGLNARKLAVEKFDSDNMVLQLEDIFKKVLEKEK
jgi:glycosyltransferase involved in cell wall biosynthesis